MVVGLVWTGLALAWSWIQDQYYVGEQDGVVVIYRGLDASLPGFDLSKPYESSNVELDRLSDFDARQVQEGIDAGQPRRRAQHGRGPGRQDDAGRRRGRGR